MKKDVLENFAKFTEKPVPESLLFNKVAVTDIRDSGTGVFL